MNLKVIAILIFTLLLITCKVVKKTIAETSTMPDAIDEQNTSNEASNIKNTQWVISTLDGRDMYYREKNSQTIYFTLNAKENLIDGNFGCNTFFRNYNLKNNQKLSFSALASTQMMCPDVKINESQIINILKQANSFIITHGTLSLVNEKQNTIATFKKMAIADLITEKYWKLQQLNGKDISVVENQEREILFTLKSNNQRINGFAGCNSLNGAYTLEDGNKIKFNNITLTMMACPDVALDESEFLKVFKLADNYTIKADVLSLNVGQKVRITVLRRYILIENYVLYQA